MIRLRLIIFCVFSQLSLAAQTVDYKLLSDFELGKNVKSVNVYYYNLEKVDSILEKTEYLSFTERGRLGSIITLRNGSKSVNRYEFDEKDNLISFIDSSSNGHFQSVYSYADDKLFKIKMNNLDIISDSTVKVISYTKEYIKTSYTDYRENFKGEKYLYKDKNGRDSLKLDIINSDTVAVRFNYDLLGRQLKVYNYLNEKLKFKSVFSYIKNEVTQVTFNENGEELTLVKSTYDSLSNKTNERTEHSFLGLFDSRYEYLYDASHSWIEKEIVKTTHNDYGIDKEQKLIVRKITYFK